MSSGLTAVEANKPEYVDDVETATVSEFWIETPVQWEGVSSRLAPSCPERSCAARASASANVLSIATRTVPASSGRPGSASCAPFERAAPGEVDELVCRRCSRSDQLGMSTVRSSWRVAGGGGAVEIGVARVIDEYGQIRGVASISQGAGAGRSTSGDTFRW